MDSLAALRLQVEWGADEALDEVPRDHFRAASPAPTPVTPAPAMPALPSAVPARAAPAPAQAQQLAAAAGTLAELHAALDAFEGCALRATATTTVRPDGNPAARLLLVADAPGAEDDRAGVAFAGPAGRLLDRVLNSAGLDRTAVLLTPLVPWRPPGGRAPTESEIQACLPFFHRLVQLARPERLLLLGSAPARTLTGSRDSIRRLRGQWLGAAVPGFNGPLPALVMLPWDQWLRSPAAKRDCWADLLLLRQATSPSPDAAGNRSHHAD